MPQELLRNRGALTDRQQQQLLDGHVLVVGCGGLGGFVIEELTRAGVGALTVADPDTFDVTNLNRQLNARRHTLGMNKARAAAERAASIRPDCRVTALMEDFFLHAAPGADVQVAVDCLDSAAARCRLSAWCRDRGLPLVHGAVLEWYGQVGVQLPHGRLIEYLYPLHDGEKTGKQAPSVLACTVAAVASLQVAETIKLLTGMDSALHDHWLSIDLLHSEFVLFPYQQQP